MSLWPRYGDSTPIVAYTPWREVQNPTVEVENPRHFAVDVASWLARVSQCTTALLETVSWQHSADPHRTPHPIAVPLAGVFMLIVEDDPANARLVAALLAAEGTTDVRIAYSAEEALAIIRTAPIRVLIVDLLLPGMSGLALVERLKADRSTCHIVAIAVTASSAAGIESEAMRSGCAGFVQKPIDFDKLLRIVSVSLDEQATRGPNPSLPTEDW